MSEVEAAANVAVADEAAADKVVAIKVVATKVAADTVPKSHRNRNSSPHLHLSLIDQYALHPKAKVAVEVEAEGKAEVVAEEAKATEVEEVNETRR